MSLSDVHRRLADLIDRVEGSDVRVTAATPDTSGTDGTVTAELTVELSVDGGESGARTKTSEVSDGSSTADDDTGDASVTAETDADASDGDEQPASEGAVDADKAAFEPVVETSEAASRAEPTEEVDPSKQVPCKHGDCDSTFETTHGMKIHYTKTHVGSDAAVPPYRDPEQLREAYEAHDTLTGVREALGADVAVTTIRRHLLEHGIHDPDAAADADVAVSEPESAEAGSEHDSDANETTDDEPADETAAPGTEPSEAEQNDSAAPSESADDSSDEDPSESSPFETDVEVAPGISIEAFRETLHSSTTVSGVQRALDLDREQTVELLREYDLLGVVGGRVASKPDREAVCAEVDDRLRSQLTA